MAEEEQKPPERISIITFGDFYLDYCGGMYPHQRFGQAFLDQIYPDVVDPDLFYEENLEKALEVIHRDYVDFFLSYGEGKPYTRRSVF